MVLNKLFMCSLLVFSMLSPMTASNEKRGERCTECNNGELKLVHSDEGSPYWAYEQTCTHKPHGVDAIYKVNVSEQYKCNNCNRNVYITNEKYDHLECHGYN